MDKSGLEIGKLDINFSVINRENGNIMDKGDMIRDESYVVLKDKIVKDCVKETLTILKEKQER